jgi:hypothetical protein
VGSRLISTTSICDVLSLEVMMSDVPNAIARAAEARALGGSWVTAAAAARWTLAGVRRWIRDNESSWFRELYRARREAHDAARDEAVAVLRQQLRADEAKTTLQAAAALATKLPTRKTVERDQETDGDKYPAAKVLRSMSDEELERLLNPTDVDDSSTTTDPAVS